MKSNLCPSTLKVMLTEQTARKMADEFKKKAQNGQQRAYKCFFCEAWHLTHHKNKLSKH